MSLTLVRRFRRRLQQGPVFGTFSKTSDAAVVETLGLAGLDFIILDQEHGPVSFETLQHLIRAADLAGALPLVRTQDRAPEHIGKALDLGAGGVQVPQVTTAEEARQVVAAARFAPLGSRGVCRFVRAAGYSSVPKAQYFRQANEALVIVQLEGETALRNLDAILDVKGVDLVFIGPYDLSQSVGCPGAIDDPRVVARMRTIVRACRDRGLPVGTFVDNPAAAGLWMRQGVRYVACSVDVGILREAGAGLVTALRARVPGRRKT